MLSFSHVISRQKILAHEKDKYVMKFLGNFSTDTAHSVKSLSVITTPILHQEGLAALKTVIISVMAVLFLK